MYLMTKKSHQEFWRMKIGIILQKVKLGKFSTGNLKQGEMHHCLRGDGRSCKRWERTQATIDNGIIQILSQQYTIRTIKAKIIEWS